MKIKIGLLMASFFFTLNPARAEGPTGDPVFDYYYGEFIEHQLDADHPMTALIAEGLAESVFMASSEADFKNRLRLIQELPESHPEKVWDLKTLDHLLIQAFEERMANARQERLWWGAGGAVLGSLVAIPVGRLATKSWKSIWVALPIGAAAGGGLGFLLGHLVIMPDYTYREGMLGSDLSFDLDEIDRALSENP